MGLNSCCVELLWVEFLWGWVRVVLNVRWVWFCWVLFCGVDVLWDLFFFVGVIFCGVGFVAVLNGCCVLFWRG